MRFHASLVPFAVAVAALLAPPDAPDAPPVCDAGGPYFVECNGPTTVVQLDGSGSFDPDGDPLTFAWSESCPGVSIQNPMSATPTISLDMNGLCLKECGSISLSVSAGGQTTTCTTFIVAKDTTPPQISCPPTIEIDHDASTDPSNTGMAVALDVCNPNPVVQYQDTVAAGPANSTLITRMWTAGDGCKNSRCVQTIVVRPPPPHVDFQPGKCPNFVEVPLGGALSAAAAMVPVTVLGNDFDVIDIDVGSLKMTRFDFLTRAGVGPSIQPVSFAFVDTSTPFVGTPCDCHAVGPDGILDLALVFDRAEMIQAFGLEQLPNGTLIELAVEGATLVGVPFLGVDCTEVLIF